MNIGLGVFTAVCAAIGFGLGLFGFRGLLNLIKDLIKRRVR